MEEERSEAAIAELKDARGGIWRLIRWVHRRRPLLTALLVLAAPAHTLLTGNPPYDLLVPSASWRFVVPWLLVLIGLGIRLWGSGNLRKNEEITDSGIYRVIRHPLYFGSLSFFLAYFLTVCDPRVGIALFLALAWLVYYPTMLSEEEHLLLKFPAQANAYRPPPRFIPDLRRLPEALRTDRFRPGAAYGNLGFRSLWFVAALPLALRLVALVQALTTG